MAKGPRYDLKFRREREGKTSYKKRLALLKSKLPRFVIRMSNKNVTCQVISYEAKGDKVIVSASSRELTKLGWNGATANLPGAYLTGYLCGVRAKKAKVIQAVADLGSREVVKGSKVFAALKGGMDAGVQMNHDESALPPQERLDGAHIDAKIKAQIAGVKKKIDSKK
jgi:large subunit ribosomal protein L18